MSTAMAPAAGFAGKSGHKPKMASADRLLLAVSLVVPVLGLSLFFLYPLGLVAWRSLVGLDGSIGLGNYASVLASPGIRTATINSLWISALTTAVCVVLGFILAYALQRSSISGKGLVRASLALPLLAPSLVQALGLIFLLGRNGVVSQWTGWTIDIYGPVGLLIANVLYGLPQAVLIIEASLRHSDARYYDAAEVMGASHWQQFRDITLPNAKFGMLSAGFVVFTVTITDFGNAAVIGGDYRVLATEIYRQVVGQMNFGMGAVVGILLLIPTLVAVYIQRVASQRQFGGGSESAIPVQPSWLPARDLPLGMAVFAISLCMIVVVATVVLASFMFLWPYRMEFTLRNYVITLSGGYTPLWTSLLISLMAAGFGVVLLFLMAFAQKRLPPALARLLYFGAILPVGVPGLVLGLAYVLAFNVSDSVLGLLYGTTVIIALCNFYHYHSQGFLTMVTGMRSVPPALEESVTCLGGGLRCVLRDAILPFLTATTVSVFFFLFMRSMVTLSAVIFLFTPQVMPASVTVMRLDEAGFTLQAAAFSTCIMITVALAMLLMRVAMTYLGRKKAGA
ncbi:ABC transporter permease subunit [Telmatospirillum sp. J64-1]|uniref:ABC transporter permease subunit n=1 Tax=Telmatospirillum sp. J64-1 TaxID=2502183 RepID=UPI00115CC72D|nr:ABC transporter permease subunit [Telmatospirillum sp. J64-1]